MIQPRITIATLTLLIWSSSAAAQDDLQPLAASDADLSIDQIENLALLGKVWGYLKYRHPTITSGCVDWDQELLDGLPELSTVADRAQFQADLASWIYRLEAVDTCTTDIEAEQYFGPSTAWLEDRDLLGPDLYAYLGAVEDRKLTNVQHYVSQQPGVGNPLFDTESGYADLGELDWRYRLLALYRFWNIVEYWFPYRDVMGRDWDSVLADSIPRLYAARERDAYVLELAKLVASINDGHANLRTAQDIRPPTGNAAPPVAIRMVEGQPFVWRRVGIGDSVDESQLADTLDGLRYGDVILAVEGEPVERIFEQVSPYHGASNEVSKQRRIARYLLLGDTDSVSVTIERDGAVMDIVNRRLPRESLNVKSGYWHDRDGETFQLLSQDIAYIKLSTIENTRAAEYIAAAGGTKGLIIDIRSYPATFVVFALGQHLMTESAPFARFTIGELSEPGSFTWTQPIAIQPAEPHYGGKVVVLVDDSSVSQAEYTAMAFRAAPNAMVIGSQTAGADGNVSRIPLPGGHMATMSGIGVFYPDKSPTQRIGIVPDIEVRPTIDGLRAGRDEVLEAAVKEIMGGDIPEQEIRELAAYPSQGLP